MGIYYYSKIEFLSFTILVPFLYFYMLIMYDENASINAYVIIIVLPILSSCVAAYNYEVKYKTFIGIQDLFKSLMMLFIPHFFISAIILYTVMGSKVEMKLLTDSLLIGAVELLIILFSVLLLGKTVNKIMFEWKKSLSNL